MTSTGGDLGALAITAWAKRIEHRADLVRVDVFVENLRDDALRDVAATIAEGGPSST